MAAIKIGSSKRAVNTNAFRSSALDSSRAGLSAFRLDAVARKIRTSRCKYGNGNRHDLVDLVRLGRGESLQLANVSSTLERDPSTLLFVPSHKTACQHKKPEE